LSRCSGLEALLVLLILSVAACTTAVDTEGPVQAVRDFVVALEARDASAIIAQLEPTEWRTQISPELRAYLGLVETIDLYDEQYAVEEHDGELALVRLTGMLDYSLQEGAAAGTQPVDLLFEVVRIDGVWYLRSLDLPPPGR
jgi:hypothetical protein